MVPLIKCLTLLSIFTIAASAGSFDEVKNRLGLREGRYRLLSGNNSACSDGPISLFEQDGQLSLLVGAAIQFHSIQLPHFEDKNSENICDYDTFTKVEKNRLSQKIIQKCARSASLDQMTDQSLEIIPGNEVLFQSTVKGSDGKITQLRCKFMRSGA